MRVLILPFLLKSFIVTLVPDAPRIATPIASLFVYFFPSTLKILSPLCAGSGSELAELALSQGAGVYITAEVKHHVARWAEDAGIWILDAGHFPTENPAMPLFARDLRELFAERHWEIREKVVTNCSRPMAPTSSRLWVPRK